MSKHKNTTISFRVSERERAEIDARVKASGMNKQDYFIRSCIYNQVCVVGKKEVVYELVEELRILNEDIEQVLEQLDADKITITRAGVEELKNDCIDMIKAILWLLEGAKYLWKEQ
ncbi:MAG: hypothetical protein R3Y24_16020 [Eubacteriales bacterium]